MSAAKSQLQIFHSRPVVPTRRIALGTQIINPQPVSADSNLTLGGLLLASVVGRYSSSIHPDLWEDLEILIDSVSRGRRVPQPFMRFRLQTDKVGLTKTTHSLTQFEDGSFDLDISHAKSSAVQQILGALYVAYDLDDSVRPACIEAIRTALSWWGSDTTRLLEYLLETHLPAEEEFSISWALDILGIDPEISTINPTGAEVQRHFRAKLWSIHPDRGGDPALASQLIPELAEARRVLLTKQY